MKKNLLLIAVLLWTGALAFGETGYGKFEWGMARNNVIRIIGQDLMSPTEEEQSLGSRILKAEKLILGKRRNVFFRTEYNRLKAIGYIVEPGAIKNTNYGQLVKKTKIADMELIEEEYAKFFDLAIEAEAIEDYGEEAIQATYEDNLVTKEIPLIIYDYNNDTRVYIFELENQTVVVYVPHEQDY